jgi:hypothetical protein
MPQRDMPSTCRDRFRLHVSGPDSAGAYGAWTGKWLLFVPAEQVDDRWPVVAGATLAGQLEISAKVATALQATPNGKYIICVHTADCRDRRDVERVLTMLRKLGHGGRLSYKEDGATYARIYDRGAALYVAQASSTVFEQQ